MNELRFSLFELILAVILAVFIASPGFAWAGAESLSVSTILSSSSSLHQIDDPDYSSDLALTVAPKFKLAGALAGYSLGGRVDLAQTFSPEATFAFSDLSLKLTAPARGLNPFLRLTPALGAVLPLSQDSRERASLITGIKVSANLGADFTRMGAPGLGASFDFSVQRNFHVFDTATTGSPNAAYKINQWVSAGYEFTDRVAFSMDLIRSASITYGGKMRNAFSLSEEFSFLVGPRVSLAVGHSNEGSALQANGMDSNLALANGESSRIYGSMICSF